ncbi:anti-sigma factor family protein [Deinococcus maricopensis]|uniref:Polymer-forming cytoskeletal protein n=1 Tax=Deinococcus maricopensis (strain DSM 21211 / LMG 22137 / NRRL B-23946 / LB-34) TaxID=709986 RepID=E8U4J2_DEIML|nr:hypothetical protein [Deinococcus maricopensis]ADV68857.1 hypothetical protein Deima_3230 [Deinococcus maricopensis DSM 21211]
MTDRARELLHLALEGDLTVTDREALTAALKDPEVAAQYARLQAVQAALRETPVMPRSVAADVAREVALTAALVPPAMPASVAARVVEDVRAARALSADRPTMPRSVAASVTARIGAASAASTPLAGEDAVEAALRGLTPPPMPASVAASVVARVSRDARRNPAPTLLVGGLVVALALMGASQAGENLTAGATVLRALAAQLSPLAVAGFALLMLASLLVSVRPTPRLQRAGGLAFALAAILTVPGLWSFAGGDGTNRVRVGGNVVVDRTVPGNVLVVGGDVILKPGADVRGEVVALLGDVQQEEGAHVEGTVGALLGTVDSRDRDALSTAPVARLGTASAFQPLLSWLGSGAWPRVYVALLGGLMALLFLRGVAPRLASAQRHAPVRTLALGTLALGVTLPPLLLAAMSGFLAPALVGAALLVVAFSVGLVVSLYDAGRAVTRRAGLPLPDTVGALLGLSAFTATLGVPPLALAAWLIGGAWGAGTLILTRRDWLGGRGAVR